MGLHLAQQGLLGLGRGVLQVAAKAQGRIVGAALDVLVQPVERAAADEQDVGGVDLDELLLGVLAAALGRHVADRALDDLEQGLLHALAAHVPGDGGVLALAGDLVDLINVNDPDLRPLDVEVRRLDQLEQDVFHVLAHIAGLGQGGGVGDGEGHAQHPGQGLGKQSLAHAGGAQQQDVGFLQLHVVALAAHDPLVVVVHLHGQHPLGVVLADDVLVQAVLDLLGGQDVHRRRDGRLHPGPRTRRAAPGRAAAAGAVGLFGQQVVAKADALAADVDAGPDDHPLYFVLMLAAEAANEVFFIFISAGIVICHSCTFLYCAFLRSASPAQRWAMTSSTRPYSLASRAVI